MKISKTFIYYLNWNSDYYSKSAILYLVINSFKHFWVVVITF